MRTLHRFKMAARPDMRPLFPARSSQQGSRHIRPNILSTTERHGKNLGGGARYPCDASSPSSVAFALEKRKRGNKWVRCGGGRSLGSRVSQHLAMRCRVPAPTATGRPRPLHPSHPCFSLREVLRPAGCWCCPFADSNQHRFISIILSGPPRRRPDYSTRAEGGASLREPPPLSLLPSS